MDEILNFKKGATIIKLNTAITHLKCPGYFNIPLQEIYSKNTNTYT
jgi:hypothetical protein